MADTTQAGSGDFMSKFLPGLVLGLVIGLGVGAFGLPFVTDRAPAVSGDPIVAAPGDRPAMTEAEREGLDVEDIADPFEGMTQDQIDEAIADWKAAHPDELDTDASDTDNAPE